MKEIPKESGWRGVWGEAGLPRLSLPIYREVWEPLLRLPRATMPLLWLTGPRDAHFSLDVQQASYRAATGPRMVSVPFDMKHGHPPGWNPPDSYAFAKAIVETGRPWARELTNEIRNGSARVEFEVTRPIDGATLIFKRAGDWEKSAAKFETSTGRATATAPVPDGTTAYYFNLDAGGMTLSSEYQTKAESTPMVEPAVKGEATSQATSQPKARKQARAARPATTSGPHAFKAEPALATARRPQFVAPPSKGERIVLLGNGLAERDVYYHRIETELDLRYPEHELAFRNMGHVGDTPGFRPHPSRASQWAFPGAEQFHPEFNVHKGQGFFPTPDQWLTHLKADTIIAFFGYNEFFDGPTKVANFEAELSAWVQHTLSKAYNGEAAPRVVLVSPIAYENPSAKRDLPDGVKENANLALYTKAIASVAKQHGLTFINLFNPMQALYRHAREPLTSGGFIPNDEGYQQVAKLLATGVFGNQARTSQADPAIVHGAVKQKDYFWNNDYNLVNGVHAYGRRYGHYGPQNYPDEVKKTREMTALRDTVIHEVARGRKTDLVVDDSQTHVLPPVPTNYTPSIKNGTT